MITTDAAMMTCENLHMNDHTHIWLAKRLEELPGKSQSGLAIALGVDRSAVTRIIKGEREVKSREVPILACYLGMAEQEVLLHLSRGTQTIMTASSDHSAPDYPVSEVDTGSPSLSGATLPAPLTSQIVQLQPHSTTPLPLSGSAAGGTKEDGAFEMNGQAVDWVERPPNLAGVKDAYGVYVWGDSMEPRFSAGTLLYVNPHVPIKRGNSVVIQVRAEGLAAPLAFVKSFISRDENRIIVEQFNPQKKLDWAVTDVLSVHRVVGTKEG